MLTLFAESRFDTAKNKLSDVKILTILVTFDDLVINEVSANIQNQLEQ